ncbi:hypothetical protein AGMMS49991_07810 [Spirochaetia bacterium]|nr:hypothetical protein AGMMS49991_07810 [Spirochaetia bacterium]
MIISVLFSKAVGNKPSGEEIYNRAIYYNPAWKFVVARIIKTVSANPAVGRHIEGLPFTPDTSEDNIHELTHTEIYRKKGAMGAYLPNEDKDPHHLKDKDKARLVFLVKDITSIKQLLRHVRFNKGALLQQILPNDLPQTKSGFSKGKFHYMVISEVGGHYIWQDKSIQHESSAIEDLSWMDEYFDASLPEDLHKPPLPVPGYGEVEYLTGEKL